MVEAGAKFAPPRIADAVAALGRAGVGALIGLVLAPHFSAASVGDYERRARAAAEALGPGDGGPLELDMIEHWHLAPGFVALMARRVTDALDQLAPEARLGATVVFTAHSIPARLVDDGDPYATQVLESATAIAEAASLDRWTVALQSAGRTADAWLGPDLRDVIAALRATSEGAPRVTGASGVVVCPVGFVSDHLEVLYDIDIEARAVADEAGITFARTASLNDDAVFCDVLAGVVLDAAEPTGP